MTPCPAHIENGIGLKAGVTATQGFTLRGAARSGLVDGWRLMLAARAIPCHIDAPQARPALQAFRDGTWHHDPDAALAAIPGVNPACPGVTAALGAMRCLDAIAPDAFPADLDLQIYTFRRSLARLCDSTPPARAHALQDADLLRAALLWRAGVLAEGFDLYLLEGFPALQLLRRELLARSDLAPHLSAAHERALLLALRAGVAPGVKANWHPALGQHESGFLRQGHSGKIPSITRTAGLR